MCMSGERRLFTRTHGVLCQKACSVCDAEGCGHYAIP